MFDFSSFAEWAQDRLSLHVCIQTGDCQVQMVGTADQSGKFHPQGKAQYLFKWFAYVFFLEVLVWCLLMKNAIIYYVITEPSFFT